MNEIELIINSEYAIQSAEKVKNYCKMFKNCKDCTFYIGCCQLSRHPQDWELKHKYKGVENG